MHGLLDDKTGTVMRHHSTTPTPVLSLVQLVLFVYLQDFLSFSCNLLPDAPQSVHIINLALNTEVVGAEHDIRNVWVEYGYFVMGVKVSNS